MYCFPSNFKYFLRKTKKKKFLAVADFARLSVDWEKNVNHVTIFPAIDDMSLKQLTLKLVMLMALLSAQGVQT